MQKRNRPRGIIFTFFIFWIFLTNSVSVKAQDVITSDDMAGGFFSRPAGFSAQKKSASSNASRVKRSSAQKKATSVRIRKQSVTIAKINAKTNPTRTKPKQVTPEMVTNPKNSADPKLASIALAGGGEYYLENDKIDDAVGIFRESLKLDKNNANAKLGLSDALTRKGDALLDKEEFDGAKAIYQEAITYNDKNGAAYAGLGEVFDLNNENDKALENYTKALGLDAKLTELFTPIGVLYYEKGDMAQADIYLTKALALPTSADNAETQLFLGLVRYKQDKIEESLAAFQRSIAIDPESAEAHYYLGETLDKVGKTNEAIAEYNKALAINPKYAEAWFDLGVAYYNAKRYEEAITAYKTAIQARNTMGEARVNLADVYRQLNRLDEAIAEYNLATYSIKDPAALAELYSKYGYVAGRLAGTDRTKTHHWKTAIDNLKKAVALRPDAVDYTNLGWAYYNSALLDIAANKKAEADAKLQLAKSSLLEATKIKANFPEAFLNLGITQNELLEYTAAIETLKRANELKKDWVPALYKLGIAYLNIKDYNNSATQFRRAVEIDSKFAEAIYYLGISEFMRKNEKEAKKMQQRLVELNRRDLSTNLDLIIRGARKIN